MNSENIIGQRINKALALRNIKQKDLAAHLNVTDNTISYFCSGKRTPNTLQIIQISKFLHVSSDYLLGITRYPTTDKDLNAICNYTGLSQLSVEFIVALNSKNIGDVLCSPVEENREIYGCVTSELDRPIHILNLLLENREILGLMHSYFTVFNEKNKGVYTGDVGASLLLEMGYKLRQLRDEYQPEYISQLKQYYANKETIKGENLNENP